MVFKPSLNITEQIADHLARLVIGGELSGGARIQELKIANELGVSRGSVREALLILERRHLIEIVPRRGAVVNEINVHEALDLMDLLSSVEHRWYQILMRDGSASESLQAAEATLLTMDVAARTNNVDDLVQARADFYDALLASANRYMGGVFECLFPTSQRLMRTLVEHEDVDLHDIARYYRALHGALDAADAERVDELLSAFHKRLHQLCLKAFGGTPSSAAAQWSKGDVTAAANSA